MSEYEPAPGEAGTQRLPVIERTPETAGSPGLDQSASSAAYGPVGPGGVKAHRFWSPRRTPALLLALVVIGAAGVLLYDISAVRAGRPAMHWRKTAVDDLATRPLDDTWVLVGAGVAAALGLWLILLAATPGLRSVLPMRRTTEAVRAGLDREAAALVLRDRAMEVAGVQSVRINLKRSKVSVRAVSHFRELDDVRADLDTALGAGITDLGLAKPPGLSVHVNRPAKKK
ncbi:DUF6286 domain-containing protein [Streptomyces sp. NBC_01465]|uniref:DUF6286 domain-containing protein n=1 Tax=Streptomyces sp. NBC_01465 TaxID=2903878 RepID=UPI002E2EBB22|nr:DUF6286 domain-containing protein [Streptomyces sp. NBC_01465]